MKEHKEKSKPQSDLSILAENSLQHGLSKSRKCVREGQKPLTS